MGRTRVTFIQAGLEWASEAACKDVHVDLFYPEDPMDYPAPKSVCKRCPVRTECLEYALVNREAFGIWGGLTPKERRKIDRRERKTFVFVAADAGA